MNRTAKPARRTAETEISLEPALDGPGLARLEPGIGFFDHILATFARHALIRLTLAGDGDLEIDAHHTVEDAGIAPGQAIAAARDEKHGIARYGEAWVAMDEALAEAAIDRLGRGLLGRNVSFPRKRPGTMDTELFEEFSRALAANSGFALPLAARANTHHLAEISFKAAARVLRAVVAEGLRQASRVSSTEGTL